MATSALAGYGCLGSRATGNEDSAGAFDGVIEDLFVPLLDLGQDGEPRDAPQDQGVDQAIPDASKSWDMAPDAGSPGTWAIAGGAAVGEGKSIKVDSQGNSYVTGTFKGTMTLGSTTLTSQGWDIFVAKVDSTSKFVWANSAGGAGDDTGNGIAMDSSGNCYITGEYQGTATFGSKTITSQGWSDIFVAKVDPTGKFIWASSAGGPSSEEGYGIATDGTGNSYLTGAYWGNATFGTTTLVATYWWHEEVFVAKLDSTGQFLWAKSAGTKSAGVITNNKGSSIAVDNAGNSYISGFFTSNIVFDSTTLTPKGGVGPFDDVFVAKLDSTGKKFLWAVSAGGTEWDEGYGVAVDKAGNSYVTGRFTGTADFGNTTLQAKAWSDTFVAKLDSTGKFVWAKSAGGAGDEWGNGVAVDSLGNSYVTGRFQGAQGAAFGSTTLTDNGEGDVFATKLDSTGNFLWAKSAGGTDWDEGYGVAVDSLGNSYATGLLDGTVVNGELTAGKIFVWKLSAGSP